MAKKMTKRERAAALDQEAETAEELDFEQYARAIEGRIDELDSEMKESYKSGELRDMIAAGAMLSALREHYKDVCREPGNYEYFRLDEGTMSEMYACFEAGDIDELLAGDADRDRIYS